MFTFDSISHPCCRQNRNLRPINAIFLYILCNLFKILLQLFHIPIILYKAKKILKLLYSKLTNNSNYCRRLIVRDRLHRQRLLSGWSFSKLLQHIQNMPKNQMKNVFPRQKKFNGTSTCLKVLIIVNYWELKT